jgi:hypothetical protein
MVSKAKENKTIGNEKKRRAKENKIKHNGREQNKTKSEENIPGSI